MQVAIAGAHGQIGLRLGRMLAQAGDDVVGLIRNPDQASDLEAAGVRPVVCDLERASVADVATAVAGAEVVVFAAGAGPGSGAERKLTMDRDGAVKLLQASQDPQARYLMVSSVGAQAPPAGDDVFSVYLRAKAQADEALIASDRDWVIVRPGPLGDGPGSGRVRLSSEPFRAEIPRADVAALLAALARRPEVSRTIIYSGGGDTPLEEALSALTAA